MVPHPFSSREITIFNGVLQLAATGADLGQLKVQDIADAAGMGKGTLYEYFRSKEEIFLGTLFFCVEQELAKLEALMDSCPDFETLSQRSLDYVAELIATRASSYQMVALTLRPSEHIAQCGPSMVGYGKRLETLMRRSLSLGQQSGVIRPDCEFAYFCYTIVSVYLTYANALFHKKGSLHPNFSFFPEETVLRRYTQDLLRGALN